MRKNKCIYSIFFSILFLSQTVLPCSAQASKFKINNPVSPFQAKLSLENPAKSSFSKILRNNLAGQKLGISAAIPNFLFKQGLEQVTTQNLFTRRRAGIEMGFRFFGEGNYLFGQNDFNDHLQGIFDSFNNFKANTPDMVLNIQDNPLTTGFGGGAEFYIDFIPEIGIGLGVGYLHQKANSTLFINSVSFFNYESDMSFTVQTEAIPVTLTLYLGLPIKNVLKIVVYGGAGYYFGKVDWNETFYSRTLDDSHFTDYSQSWLSRSNAIGYQAGLHFEINLSRWMSLTIGGGGRLVNFTDLIGDYNEDITSSSFSSQYTEEDTKLWFGKHNELGFWADKIDFEITKPTVLWKNVRRGEVTLNEFTIQLGLKFKFSTFTSR